MKKVFLILTIFSFWSKIDLLAQITSPPGNALGLSGSGQYVQVASNAALETANATIEAWVKPQWGSGTPSQLPCIVGMSKPSVSRYDIYINKDYSGVTVWNNAANLSFGFAFAQNQLYHIALVFGNTTSSLFVNGYLVNTISGTLNNASAVPLFIGSSDGTKEYFNGMIDEVRIWNVQRTSQQIRENMHLPLTGSEPGLVSYYQFNETSGTTTADAKSGFTGTFTGTPTRPASVFPFGGGTVNTQLESPGAVTFTGTNLSANYTTQNGASITTTEINSPSQPNTLPSGGAIKSGLSNQYWVMNRFGSGSYNTSLTFKTSEDLTAADAASPGTIQLYRRNITSDGSWSYFGAASSVDATNDLAVFSGVTSGLGDMVLVRGYALSTSLSGTSFCTPASVSVSYDATGITFNAGNVFTAQLSNSSGSFASPTAIGSIASTSSTGSIATTLDQYLASGTGYRVRVISSNPVVTVIQDNGTSLTVTNPIENATVLGIPSGMPAYYKLDANAIDSSPNGYSGTTVGGVTATTDHFGNASSAMNFNGTNSGIDVGDQVNLRMYSSFSISAWIRPTTLGSTYTIVTKYYNSESYKLRINSSNQIVIDANNVSVTGTSQTLTANQWTHIVATVVSGNWKIYKDNVVIGSSSASVTLTDSFGAFQIGKDGSSQRFAGDLDEIRIYNRVLTAAEVQILYNNGIAANNSPVCEGGSVTLSALSVPGATYSWAGPNSFSSSAQNPPSLTSVTTTASGTYVLTTSKSGCSSSPQKTIVTVNAIAAAPGVADVARCSNGTVTLTATGSTNGNYRWYTVSSGGSPIGGQVNSTYTTPSLTSTTPYWVSSLSAGCEGPRAQINAIINTPIDVSLATSATSPVCHSASTSVTVTGSETSATYQVFKGATAVSSSVSGGGTIIINVPASGLTSGANTLKVTATKAGCGSSDLTNTISVTVNDAPSITAQPSPQSKCTGNNVSFSVSATGTGLTYQWRLGTTNLTDGGSISGATTATITISGLVLADAGNYNCVVSGSCAPAATSNNAALTVISVTTISSQPANDTKCAGQSSSFSVTASAPGSTLTFQWRKGTTNLTNGGNVSGATSATLTLSNVAVGDAGNYNCVVSGGCNPVTSSDGTLTVNTPPAITGQPANDSKCVGANSTFTVTATGSALTYQWRKGTTNLADGGNISGVTSATLTLSNLVVGDAGNYNCVVSGTCSPSVTSNNATLTVSTGASITSQPANDAKCPGASSGFTVAATGAGLTYQWQKGTTNLVNGGNISGATSATLTLSNISLADGGNYRCIVSATCGSPQTSNNATLAINTAPSITTLSADDVECAGASSSFSITATGTGLTYQWRKGTTNLSNGGNISGATTATLSISNITSTDAGNYNCVVSGTCSPSVTSASAALSLYANPVITAQPTDDTKCAGQNTGFSVTATGAGLTYQWRKGTTNLSNGGNISGATSATLSINNVASADAGNYNCVVSGTCGSPVISNNAALTIGATVTITGQPIDDTKCAAASASFSVTASGGSLTYQWRKGTTNLIDGGRISGATSATLIINNLVAADAGGYNCVVSIACGSTTSGTATLTVNSGPSITAQPSNSVQCNGQNASFSVTASGVGVTYQWRKGTTNLVNGGSVSGATSATLQLGNIAPSDAGNYNCVVSGMCTPSVTSNDGSLTVVTLPTIIVQPADDSKISGQSATFTLTAAGATGFQWKKGTTNLSNGGSVLGATTSTLTINNLKVADAGSYSCDVSNTCGTTSSAAGLLTVNAAPAAITFTSPSTEGTEGDQLVISATSNSPSPIVFSITGGTGQGSFDSPGNLKLTLAGTIEVTASQVATADYTIGSAAQLITVNPDLITAIKPGESGKKPQFFPNPAHENILVEITTGQIDKILLVDVNGVAIREWAVDERTSSLNIDGLSQGIYHLRTLKQGIVVSTERIVKY